MDEHAHSGENENFGRKTADARSHFPCRFCILTFPPHLARPRNARPFLEGAARPPKRGLINRRVILSTDRSRSSVNCSSCWPPGKKKKTKVSRGSLDRPRVPVRQQRRTNESVSMHSVRLQLRHFFFFFCGVPVTGIHGLHGWAIIIRAFISRPPTARMQTRRTSRQGCRRAV